MILVEEIIERYEGLHREGWPELPEGNAKVEFGPDYFLHHGFVGKKACL